MGPRHIVGIGRDIYTPTTGGEPEVLASEEVRATMDSDGSLVSLRTNPGRSEWNALIGEQRLRGVLGDFGSTSLFYTLAYQMIDDIPGAMVVADWAWSRWPQFLARDEKVSRATRLSKLEGVCIGFGRGSSALVTDGGYQNDRAAIVPAFANPLDQHGWHHPPEVSGVSMRRARFIDLWCEDVVKVEAGFQDSATTPEDNRVAVHEYEVHVRAELRTLRITEAKADPYILPFVECPNATNNLSAIVGQPLTGLRATVPLVLRRELGCTHLNDTLRSLSGMASFTTLACERR